ncbi:hypothetical protein [Sporomusa aerivorans]|uniref:hypothetical protein n=1 Tax=Sporomusa aerivorans TaxID=204936 RepID=UPI00352AA11F
MDLFSRSKPILKELDLGIQMDSGAPSPVILSNEHIVMLIFYLNHFEPNWNGTTIHVRDNNDDVGVACVQFRHYKQVKYGWPNDEAYAGHKYKKLGLLPYRIYEVENSDWYAELEKGNSVHPYHNKERFMQGKHYIFFFHDSCFEVICKEIIVETHKAASLNTIAKHKAMELFK